MLLLLAAAVAVAPAACWAGLLLRKVWPQRHVQVLQGPASLPWGPLQAASAVAEVAMAGVDPCLQAAGCRLCQAIGQLLWPASSQLLLLQLLPLPSPPAVPAPAAGLTHWPDQVHLLLRQPHGRWCPLQLLVLAAGWQTPQLQRWLCCLSCPPRVSRPHQDHHVVRVPCLLQQVAA